MIKLCTKNFAFFTVATYCLICVILNVTGIITVDNLCLRKFVFCLHQNSCSQPNNVPTATIYTKSLVEYVDKNLTCNAAGVPLYKDPAKSHNFIEAVRGFSKFMERTGMPIFLFHGSLLGWRRECDVIAHTSDVDFAADAADLSPEWLRLVSKISFPRLNLQYGGAGEQETLELSWTWLGTRVDLFFLYPLGGNRSGFFTPGFRTGAHVHWEYPGMAPLRLCRGLLQGVPVRLPCEPDPILQHQYGPEWRLPQKQWNWDTSPHNVRIVPTNRSDADIIRQFAQGLMAPNEDRLLLAQRVDPVGRCGHGHIRDPKRSPGSGFWK